MSVPKLFLLTSDSAIKVHTVRDFLAEQIGQTATLFTKSAVPADKINLSYVTVEQPVSDIGGLICCKNRIIQLMAANEHYDAIVSIENAIKEKDGVAYDYVHVIIYDCKRHRYFYAFGSEVDFDYKYFKMSQERSHEHSMLGWNITAGEMMQECGITTNSKNWMVDVKGSDRHVQISSVLEKCFGNYESGICDKNEFIASLGYDLSFKKNVIFKDIGPIMANHQLMNMMIENFVEQMEQMGNKFPHIDYVLGIEARGFYLGPILADELECGFIPIRKEGKLPMDVISNAYSTEYSKDVIEVQPYLFAKPGNILVVDDLMATGGSFESVLKLVDKLNDTLKFKDGKLTVVACYAPLKVDGLFEIAQQKLKSTPILTYV